jgi:hypothetical protein
MNVFYRSAVSPCTIMRGKPTVHSATFAADPFEEETGKWAKVVKLAGLTPI